MAYINSQTLGILKLSVQKNCQTLMGYVKQINLSQFKYIHVIV